MPTYEFKAPNGKTYEIDGPDGSTKEQAFAQLQQHLAAHPELQGRQGADLAMHRAGVLGRGLLEGPAAGAGMIGDAMNTGINMVGQAIGHNPNLGMPSQVIQQGLDKVGLPRAEGADEHVVEDLASMFTGSKDPIMNAVTRSLPAVAPKTLTPQDTNINTGKALGYKAPPDQQGGVAGGLVGVVSGRKTLNEAVGIKNQNVTNALARKLTGVNGPITEENLANAMAATHAQGYDPIRQFGQVTTGGVYRNALDDVLKNFHGNSPTLPGAEASNVRNLVDQFRVKSFDSSDAIDAIKKLREQSYATTDPNMKGATKGIAQALENNLELNLSGSATSLAKQGKGKEAQQMIDNLYNFRDARKTLGHQDVVRQALNRDTGDVDLNKIASLGNERGPGYLQGDLADAAAFSNSTNGTITGIPKIQHQPFYTSPIKNAATSIILGALGLPHVGAATAAFPVAQHFLRSGLMSDAGQRMLQPSLNPSLMQQALHNRGLINGLPAGIMNSGLYSPYDEEQQNGYNQ